MINVGSSVGSWLLLSPPLAARASPARFLFARFPAVLLLRPRARAAAVAVGGPISWFTRRSFFAIGPVRPRAALR
jgi:hypothetical protein